MPVNADINDEAGILRLITTKDPLEIKALFEAASKTRDGHCGNLVFFRGLIEFTNYCKNDCFYCGIRKNNRELPRYRLSLAQVLECCELGDALGFRTFVLQGGEDAWFTDGRVAEIVSAIREKYPEHAITLSIGERSINGYQAFFKAGANRYLLRHETADEAHYSKLHPGVMKLSHRKSLLYALKDMGYQVGAGFMVGSPFQTPQTLLEDLRFLCELKPHMVGIGPFIPHRDTPLSEYPAGSLELSLKMIALCRLLLPGALIPATTALGSVSPVGREMGFMAGANVVMPNLSPVSAREKYALYDNKLITGAEAAEGLRQLERQIRSCGLVPDMSRGDAGSARRL